MNQATQTLSGGEAVVEMLDRFGVEVMFGLPGDQTDIYDALYHRPSIRHVLVRHEQGAAHMADGYARVTGKVGVCDAAIGPGTTNLISGISEAYLSGIPVVALASDVRSEWRGRECFQEVDQVSLFRPITKATFDVDRASRIPELMKRAFQIAVSGRPGPVLVNLPIDVLKQHVDFSEQDLAVDPRYGQWPPLRQVPESAEIDRAVEMLRAAKRPVILAGGGVMASGAWAEVQALAEHLDIPVATSFMGKGTLPESHPLALGPYGLIGRPETNDYVLQADFALAVGTRFTNVDTVAWRVPDRSVTMVQIDVEPTQLGRNYPVDLGLAGDLKATLQAMLDRLGPAAQTHSARDEVSALTERWRQDKGIEKPSAAAQDTSPVHPLQVIRALRTAMSDEDILVCDSGFNQIWGGQYFEVQSSGRCYMGPRGFGVMGFAMPAAIGASIAKPEQRVVALAGDGGFAMVLQELETALRAKAKITVVIMNNANLQYIRENQRLLFEGRFISTDFIDLNFAAIAEAFGCFGVRVERSGDIDAALQAAFDSPLPAIVDVRTDPDAVPDRISLQKLDKAPGGSKA